MDLAEGFHRFDSRDKNTGEYIMPFGKHKGKMLKEVPVMYFQFLRTEIARSKEEEGEEVDPEHLTGNSRLDYWMAHEIEAPDSVLATTWGEDVFRDDDGEEFFL